jgi:hypothetical protein
LKIVIVAAAEFEIAPTREVLESMDEASSTEIIGIGALNAAKAAPRLIAACRQAYVLFVGTCGTFGTFDAPYLCTPSSVDWLPTAVRTRNAYSVSGTTPQISVNPGPLTQSLPYKRVLCSPAISTIETLPAGYEREACVENLELYSCVDEITKVASLFSCILTVTNAIGPLAHNQWQANFPHAAQMTADFIKTNWRTRGI